MKAKYLGRYYSHVEFIGIENGKELIEYKFTHIDDEDDYYESELFMTANDSKFDGIMTETNTSAIAAKISDDGELIKLWRIW